MELKVMSMGELKRWRERLEISRSEVARQLGLTPSSLFNYETDRRRVRDFLINLRYEDFLRRVDNGEIRLAKKHRGCTMKMRNATRCRGAKELRKAREKLGIFLSRVGEELNLDATTISNYEKELFLMPVDKFEQYKKFLKKVKLERIFGKKEEK